MARTIRLAILVVLSMVAVAGTAETAKAGWGHRWGYSHWGYGHWGHSHWGHSHWGHSHWGHSHWSYRPIYGSWGWPAYRSYTYIYVGLPRYRYVPTYYYPTYSVNYYVPPVSYSVALPTYYYSPVYYAPTYCAPTTYVAPITYSSSYCDPCVSSLPSSILNTPSTTYSTEYSTGVAPPAAVLGAGQVASRQAGPSATLVDRMLASRFGGLNAAGRLADSPVATRSGSPATLSSSATAGKTIRTVSTVQPVAQPGVHSTNLASLEPIPQSLLQTADQMFALGGYAQAASAYARMAVRFGDHDALAVRRFIALVASGDHQQAAVVFQLAQAKGQSLNANSLPGSSLTQFYGELAANKPAHVEALASFAMNSSTDPVALAVVGKWLELDQQPERAALFNKRAAQLTTDAGTQEVPASDATTLAWLRRD